MRYIFGKPYIDYCCTVLNQFGDGRFWQNVWVEDENVKAYRTWEN